VDEKATIRAELAALRSKGQSASPGAVFVPAPQGKTSHAPMLKTPPSGVAAEGAASIDRRVDEKATIRAELAALRSKGQSASPGAVAVPAPQGPMLKRPPRSVAAEGAASIDRRADEKATIRGELAALRSKGQSASPGAVFVPVSSPTPQGKTSHAATLKRPPSGVAAQGAANMDEKATIRGELAALRSQGRNAGPGAVFVPLSAPHGKAPRQASRQASSRKTDDSKADHSVSAQRTTEIEDKLSKMESMAVGPTAVGGDWKGSIKSLKENGVAMGIPMGEESDDGKLVSAMKESALEAECHVGEEYYEPQNSLDENHLFSAMVIDEDEMEAEYQERVMENAVTAEVVSEVELKRKGRFCRTFLCCLCIGVIFAIVLPLTLQPAESSLPPTSAPTPQSDYEFLEDMFLPISGDVLFNETTPQFQALEWLAFEDPAMLPLKQTSTSILIGRYVLAVLYYSTGGPEWFDNMRFLSNYSYCDWQPEGPIRILCYEDKENIRSIVLGKC
jgi:hypothetical protein